MRAPLIALFSFCFFFPSAVSEKVLIRTPACSNSHRRADDLKKDKESKEGKTSKEATKEGKTGKEKK